MIGGMTFEIGSNLATVLVALFAAVPAIIAALYARSAAKGSDATHELVNSRMGELLTAATGVAKAEGVAQGEQAQRDRSGPHIP